MTYVEILREKYVENESYLCVGHPEPHIRHQDLIVHFQQRKWNVKVTFRSEAIEQQFENPGSHDTCIFVREPIRNKLERCREFENFVQFIDFNRLPIIPDTVTEVDLLLQSSPLETPICCPDNLLLVVDTPKDVQNRFLTVASTLKVTIQEDPLRVQYPVYTKDLILPEVLEEEISMEDDFHGSALLIKRAGENQCYIYEKVNRPFYDPSDTFVLQTELQNLKLLRSKSHIVYIRCIVISSNPYQTTPTHHSPLVTRGFLLEYHPHGTLEDRLRGADLDSFPWRLWPLQIGLGLLHFHQRGITHMDLKPSNVVIDVHDDAVLIDISEIGGITFEWAAPELRDKGFIDLSQEDRVQGDI